jgi:hypothetical protein
MLSKKSVLHHQIAIEVCLHRFKVKSKMIGEAHIPDKTFHCYLIAASLLAHCWFIAASP